MKEFLKKWGILFGIAACLIFMGSQDLQAQSTQQFPKQTIGSGDGTGYLATVNSSGQLLVSGSFMPSGLQNVNLTQIGSTNVGATNGLYVQPGTGATFSISASVLPLPTGASTSALQTTGNGYLSTLATNLPAQGQALAAGSLPVVLTASQISTLTPITGGATSANQTNATQKTQIVDGSGNVIASTGNALNVAGTITSGPGYTSTTGTITTNSTTISLPVKQYSTAVIQTTGTYAGITETFKESFDNGATYQPFPMSLISTTPAAPVTTAALATNASVVYQANLEGATNFEVVSTAYTSGTANVVLTATTNPVTNYVNAGIINNPTVTLGAGSAIAAKFGIDQTTVGTTNGVSIAQIGTTTVVNGGAVGTLGVGGVAANGTAIASSGNPVVEGGEAVSSEITAQTTAHSQVIVTDLSGKQITSPYANRENWASGTASATGTSSTSLIAAQGAGLKIYAWVSCGNTGATTTAVAIQNGSGGTTLATIIVPAGGGNNDSGPIPLTGMSANTGLYFASGSSTTTLYCNARAFVGY